jgi:hypothetical protein
MKLMNQYSENTPRFKNRKIHYSENTPRFSSYTFIFASRFKFAWYFLVVLAVQERAYRIEPQCALQQQSRHLLLAIVATRRAFQLFRAVNTTGAGLQG